MTLSDNNELAEFEADLAQRMVNRARGMSTILNLQVADGQEDVGAWVPGQSGNDPDLTDNDLNAKNAARGRGSGPGDWRAIWSQLDDLYGKISSRMEALRNHIERARPNAAGSTPSRPFPDTTGRRGTQNAFDKQR
jgi:hypothetical protein